MPDEDFVNLGSVYDGAMAKPYDTDSETKDEPDDDDDELLTEGAKLDADNESDDDLLDSDSDDDDIDDERNDKL